MTEQAEERRRVGWQLHGRRALVTGGSRGIGRATVLELAANGADVVFSYVREGEQAEAVVAEGRRLGARVWAVQADLQVKDDVLSLAEAARQRLGGVDTLINSAGFLRDQLLVHMADDEWESVLGVHLHGLFHLTRALTLDLMRSRGRVVNLTSVAGLAGAEGQANYAAAKAGVIGFTKSLARELGRFGVRVNAVAPGYTQTDLLAAVHPKKLERQVQATALRRVAAPEEVAGAILFLVSDAASFMTGQVLVVDGGLLG